MRLLTASLALSAALLAGSDASAQLAGPNALAEQTARDLLVACPRETAEILDQCRRTQSEFIEMTVRAWTRSRGAAARLAEFYSSLTPQDRRLGLPVHDMSACAWRLAIYDPAEQEALATMAKICSPLNDRERLIAVNMTAGIDRAWSNYHFAPPADWHPLVDGIHWKMPPTVKSRLGAK